MPSVLRLGHCLLLEYSLSILQYTMIMHGFRDKIFLLLRLFCEYMQMGSIFLMRNFIWINVNAASLSIIWHVHSVVCAQMYARLGCLLFTWRPVLFLWVVCIHCNTEPEMRNFLHVNGTEPEENHGLWCWYRVDLFSLPRPENRSQYAFQNKSLHFFTVLVYEHFLCFLKRSNTEQV